MNKGLRTSQLIAYAWQRISDLELTGSVWANVYEYDEKADPKPMDKKHPNYERQKVTILDSMAWFDCSTCDEIDRAVRLFAQSPRDQQETTPVWNVRDEDLFINPEQHRKT